MIRNITFFYETLEFIFLQMTTRYVIHNLKKHVRQYLIDLSINHMTYNDYKVD